MTGTSEGVPVWPRPHWVAGGGAANVTLFVFSQVGVDGSTLPLKTRAHGVPAGGLPEGVDVQTVARVDAPDWVNGFFSPALMALAERDLGWKGAPPVEPTAVHVVKVESDDPSDLRHIQGAWALARAFVDTGGFALLDAHAHAWLAPQQLADRPFDGPMRMQDEVSIVFETEPSHDYGHLLHTRGLLKFGRPDLIVHGIPPKHGVRIADIVNQLAERLALGARLDPGDTIDLEGLGALRADAYEPGTNAPDLQLNNRGLVLVPLGRGVPASEGGEA
ncbi:MAG: hypothetical protein KDA24_16375 [Deltaproteobacteria bacterium]|nr:hypothetical protein [Deltaproteobacteria bacterium]